MLIAVKASIHVFSFHFNDLVLCSMFRRRSGRIWVIRVRRFRTALEFCLVKNTSLVKIFANMVDVEDCAFNQTRLECTSLSWDEKWTWKHPDFYIFSVS